MDGVDMRLWIAIDQTRPKNSDLRHESSFLVYQYRWAEVSSRFVVTTSVVP